MSNTKNFVYIVLKFVLTSRARLGFHGLMP